MAEENIIYNLTWTSDVKPSNDTQPYCPYGNCSNSTCVQSTGTGNPFLLSWYLQLLYYTLFVSMVVVAAGGNLIVIWIVVAHKRMRTVTNYFLVNLAVADVLISILNTLFNFVYMVSSHWPFHKEYCRFSLFIAPCTISVSVFTFMAIAIDRFMAIIHPLKPRMGAGTVLCVIGVIWLASILVAFPNLIFAKTHTWAYCSGYTRTVCYLEWPDGVNGVSDTDFVYNIFLMLVNYFVPLSILTGTYIRVGKELWGSQTIGEYTYKQEENVKSKRRIVKMMIAVVVIFGVCWLPQHVFFIVTSVNEGLLDYTLTQHVYLVIYWLAMSNCMYNPMIYCWMNARFRHGFQFVFRWLPCVKWTPVDKLGHKGAASVRMSLSDGASMTTKYERNGSLGMHTMVESLDETSYVPPSGVGNISHKGYVKSVIKEEDETDAL